VESPNFDLNWIDYTVVGVYFLGVIAHGLWASRKNESADDYFLAGGVLPWWLIGFSLFASNMSGSSFVGLMGAAYQYGMAVFNYEWTAAVVLMIFALLILPHFLRNRIYTVPGFLEHRYDKRSRLAFSAFTLIAILFIDTAGALYAGGLVISSAMPFLNLWTAVATLALSLLVHRQWADHEQLSYPLAQISSSLLARSRGRRFPDLFHSKLFFWGFDFVFAKRRTMRSGRVLLVRATIGNMRIADNHAGTAGICLCLLQSFFYLAHIVCIDFLHLPAIGFIPFAHILGKREVSRAINRDVVAVIYHDELAKLEVPRKAGSLVRDAFHQISITGDNISIMINKRKIRLVKFCGQIAFCQCHTDSG